jgi:KDO2-lipid IV(A) lauroyltransferase
MKLRTIYLWLFYRFLEGSFLIFLGLLRILPPSHFCRLSTPVVKLLIYILVPRSRIIKNLRAAFGDVYATATKRGLAKGVQEHFVKNLVDCFLHMVDPDRTREIVTIEGWKNLEAALGKGKGVIALGAHIGNFVLVGARLGMDGYPFHTLFRVPSEQRLRTFIDRYLPYFHQQVIPSRPKRSAVKRTLDALKKNEIVFILGDNLKKGKVQTLLFGQRVPSPRGPVSLALRSGAAVVPLYLIRNYQGGLHLVIEPEILMTRNENLSEDITYNTHQIVRYLEGLIRRYPDQWNWLTVRMKRYRAPLQGK